MGANGSQVLSLAPAEGGFVEFVAHEPGNYTFVNHAMTYAECGAHGLLRSPSREGGHANGRRAKVCKAEVHKREVCKGRVSVAGPFSAGKLLDERKVVSRFVEFTVSPKIVHRIWVKPPQ